MASPSAAVPSGPSAASATTASGGSATSVDLTGDAAHATSVCDAESAASIGFWTSGAPATVTLGRTRCGRDPTTLWATAWASIGPTARPATPAAAGTRIRSTVRARTAGCPAVARPAAGTSAWVATWSTAWHAAPRGGTARGPTAPARAPRAVPARDPSGSTIGTEGRTWLGRAAACGCRCHGHLPVSTSHPARAAAPHRPGTWTGRAVPSAGMGTAGARSGTEA